jgi:hypothetical protein
MVMDSSVSTIRGGLPIGVKKCISVRPKRKLNGAYFPSHWIEAEY